MMLIYGKVSYVAMAPHRKPWQSLKNDMNQIFIILNIVQNHLRYNQLAFIIDIWLNIYAQLSCTVITSLNLSPCCPSQLGLNVKMYSMFKNFAIIINKLRKWA